MTTIAQLFQNITPYVLDKISSTLKQWHYFHLSPASLITSPFDLHNTILQPLATNIDKFYFTILKEIFDKVDQDFFNSEDRRRLYRSKGKKPRTIVTMFGKFTYIRHSYQLKTGGSHFYFIDTAFGIEKYQRFEKAVLLEIYRQIGSEISFSKVGKTIGNIIYRNTYLKEKEKSISRQTIHAILKRLDTTSLQLPKANQYTDTLYIEADEHFVASQKNKQKIMVKAAKIYTKNNNNIKQQPIYFLDTGGLFWESCLMFIQSQYDLEQVKSVYIIGDGANWIRNGVSVFDKGKAKFRLDLFHYMQSLQLFFGKNHRKIQKIATEYLLNNHKQNFLTCIEAFYTSEERKTSAFENNFRYLKNNFTNIQKSFKNKTSCSMENTISHVLASVCTSRPKGFNKETLFKRLRLRMLYLNTKDKEGFNQCFIATEEDKNSYNDVFKTFERMYKPSTYKINIPIF